MFIARLATAIVLLAVFVAAMLFLPNRWWTAFLLPALLVASWEWAALAGFNGLSRWAFAGAVLASAILIGLAGSDVIPYRLPAGGAAIYAAGTAFWVLVAVPWLAQGWRNRSRVLMAIAGWVALVPAWFALARLQTEPEKLLALLGILWISDTAAYAAGRAWGKHKLAPGISPGKTWEGIAGAAAGVAVYYVALSAATPHWSWWTGPGGAILFASVALAGVLGDLFESWIKRQAGVKDSGKLLPGHGGVLDRIDSMTAGLPIAALLLLYTA